MSFTKNPGRVVSGDERIRLNNLWNGFNDPSQGAGQGVNADAGRSCYEFKKGNDWYFVITGEHKIGRAFRVGSDVFAFDENKRLPFGTLYWEGGGGYIYKNYSGEVILIYENGAPDAFPGYVPVSWRHSETNQMMGDAWWSAGELPSEDGVPAVFAPNGTATENKEVYLHFPRWEKSEPNAESPAGVYQPKGGQAGGAIRIGVPSWKDPRTQGKIVYRSAQRIRHGYFGPEPPQFFSDFEYGDIRRLTKTQWGIGTSGSHSGWWEGSEPQAESDAVFTFTKNPESDATGEDLTFEWNGWEIVGETQSTHLFEVARWL